MLFHKRKPALTINECLNAIAQLREDLKQANEEKEIAKKLFNASREASIRYINEIDRLHKELAETKELYTLQIEKEKEYIHRLNKEIYTLNRALGIR